MRETTILKVTNEAYYRYQGNDVANHGCVNNLKQD